MVKTLKASELAKALNIATAQISMAVKRSKLIRSDDKTFDIHHALNKLWIQKKLDQGCTFDINRAYIKGIIKKPTPIKQNKPKSEPKTKDRKSKKERGFDDGDELDNYARDKALHGLKLLKNKAALAELQVSKMDGTLIPTDSVQDVVLWVIDTFHNTYSQEVKNLAETCIQVFGGDHDQLVELRKDLNESLVRQKNEAKESILSGIQGIIAEYKEVRGRGERK